MKAHALVRVGDPMRSITRAMTPAEMEIVAEFYARPVEAGQAR